MKLILPLFTLTLIVFPQTSKEYRYPELTEREVYEIRGKWRTQLKDLHPEPEEIKIESLSERDLREMFQ